MPLVESDRHVLDMQCRRSNKFLGEVEINDPCQAFAFQVHAAFSRRLIRKAGCEVLVCLHSNRAKIALFPNWGGAVFGSRRKVLGFETSTIRRYVRPSRLKESVVNNGTQTSGEGMS